MTDQETNVTDARGSALERGVGRPALKRRTAAAVWCKAMLARLIAEREPRCTACEVGQGRPCFCREACGLPSDPPELYDREVKKLLRRLEGSQEYTVGTGLLLFIALLIVACLAAAVFWRR